MIPVVWIAMSNPNKPILPALKNEDSVYRKLDHPGLAGSFSKRELKKYHGFEDFLKLKKHNAFLTAREKLIPFNDKIRAGFLTNWDPQSFYSLQNHIDKMNMILPDWFFIDPVADTLKLNVDADSYKLMRQHHSRIVPILSNVAYENKNGSFDGERIDRILNDAAKKKKLLHDILKYLRQDTLQGINIDFEELKQSSIHPLLAFQKELFDSMHRNGYIVTMDILPSDDNYDTKELSKYNDYLFLMAYDQHYSSSRPGPVSEQKWIEKVLDEMAGEIPSEKIILCMAAYGYDWPENDEATPVTYQTALSNAKQYKATIDYNNDSYNSFYEYTDNNSIDHKVYFEDAGGNFNIMRFADEYGTAGVSIWRLGAEDERLWTFYNRDLSNEALQRNPFDFSKLETFDGSTEAPNYIGDGEILNVVSEPEVGLIDIEKDSVENLVSEETYRRLPTRYVIQKFGNVNKEVILTFDDGPDPDYTPEILDILKKEHVPAAFFVVGINAEEHLPILKRIYQEGHEIGNHTFTHPNMATVSESRAETEMEATRLLIESAIGRSTIMFRAPFNADAEPTKAVELKPVARSRKDNYYTIGESIDPDDWDTEHGVNADSIVNRIIRHYEAYPDKGIILLHDAGGNRRATVEALPKIIHYFKSRGIRFTTVADLLHKTRDEVMPLVHNNMIELTGWVSIISYWIERLLKAAFWMAILLGLGKILLMGILATVQFIIRKKEKTSTAAVIITGSEKASVSIIVPAYNEEVNAIRTVKNLLLQDYPEFEIIFVDDGSKDDTYKKVKDEFEGNLKVKVFTKINGGKASALNYGIEHSDSAFVVCIDADTQLHPDAVSQLMKKFTGEKIGAVAGNVKVGNENTLLTRWQSIEYTTAQNFDRRAFDLINGITVVPGAIGAFSRSAIINAGGFTTDTLAEDCDLTIRILRHGYVIRNCSEAIAVTEAPETLGQFMKQRFRWSYGIMQSLWKNRDACFNPRYKTLGMVALPHMFLFQVLIPILAPLADVVFITSLIVNRNDLHSIYHILGYYGLFLLVDVAVSVIAFGFEKEKFYKLFWLLPQRFVYRQLMYVVLYRSIREAIKGEVQGWGILKRTGNAVLAKSPVKTMQE
jgi:cellulose synthase/poly-beta-1,6-N-acetylglucosamine synthase-like glycosyltransferase/spore germination protein YaaH/peptidoglycan/xylan/chitin deacetylase (PgdA/CDA1 family)